MLPFCTDYTSFPFKFPTFLVALAFMYIGYTIKLFDFITMHNKLVYVLASIMIVIALFVVLYTRNEVGMNENRYGNYFIFLFTSIPLSVSIVVLISRMKFLEKPALLWLGKNTLFFVGFNFLCRDIANELYNFIPIVKNHPIHWSISFLMTFGLCLLLAFVGEKIHNGFAKRKDQI